MLNNFNNLLKSVIWQDILASKSDDGNEKAAEQDPGWIKSICDSNYFFLRYLKDAAEKCNVIPTKQMENMFVLYGNLDDLMKFLKSFKVDKDYMENPSEFLMYTPVFMFGDQNHGLNVDERFPEIDYMRYGVSNTHDLENRLAQTFDGTWIDLYRGEGPKRVRIGKIKPADLAVELKNAVDLVNPGHGKNDPIWLKVEINCNGMKNTVWDEIADYVDVPDDLEKKLHEKDDYEFDYNQLHVNEKTPFEGGEEAVKMAKREK